MVLGKFQVFLLIWVIVCHGTIVLAEDAVRVIRIFFLSAIISLLFLFLPWRLSDMN